MKRIQNRLIILFVAVLMILFSIPAVAEGETEQRPAYAYIDGELREIENVEVNIGETTDLVAKAPSRDGYELVEIAVYDAEESGYIKVIACMEGTVDCETNTAVQIDSFIHYLGPYAVNQNIDCEQLAISLDTQAFAQSYIVGADFHADNAGLYGGKCEATTWEVADFDIEAGENLVIFYIMKPNAKSNPFGGTYYLTEDKDNHRVTGPRLAAPSLPGYTHTIVYQKGNSALTGSHTFVSYKDEQVVFVYEKISTTTTTTTTTDAPNTSVNQNYLPYAMIGAGGFLIIELLVKKNKYSD